MAKPQKRLVPPNGMDMQDYLAKVEKQILAEAMEQARTQREAAELLQISEACLWMKLRRHGMLKRSANKAT